MLKKDTIPKVNNEDVAIASYMGAVGNSVFISIPGVPTIMLTDTEAQILSQLTFHLARHCGRFSFTVTSGDELGLTRLPDGLVFDVKEGDVGNTGQCLLSAPQGQALGERLLGVTFRPTMN